jgi:hypothetical protein
VALPDQIQQLLTALEQRRHNVGERRRIDVELAGPALPAASGTVQPRTQTGRAYANRAREVCHVVFERPEALLRANESSHQARLVGARLQEAE